MIGYLVQNLYDSLGTLWSRCFGSLRYDGVGRSVPYVAGSAGHFWEAGGTCSLLLPKCRGFTRIRRLSYLLTLVSGHLYFGPSSAKNNEHWEVKTASIYEFSLKWLLGRSTTYKRSDSKKSNLQTTKFVYFFVIFRFIYVSITSDQVHTISSRQDIILEWNFCDHLPPAQLKNITLPILFRNCNLATPRKKPYNLQSRTNTSKPPGSRRPILTVNIQTSCCESNNKYQTNLQKTSSYTTKSRIVLIILPKSKQNGCNIPELSICRTWIYFYIRSTNLRWAYSAFSRQLLYRPITFFYCQN